MVYNSWDLYILGALLQLACCHHASGEEESEMSFLMKLTFERYPRQAWEPKAVGQFVNLLSGHLKKMLVLRTTGSSPSRHG